MSYYTYIYQNNSGIYYFRIKIPTKNKPEYNNKNEIRKSLKTRSRREALQKAHELAKIYQERFKKGEPNYQTNIEPLTLVPDEVSRVIQAENKSGNSSQRLSQCIKAYLANIEIRHPDKAEFHIKEKKPIFERLLEVVGDKEITDVTFLDATNFFTTVQQMPANMRKFFTENETIEEIINSETAKSLRKLSPRTTNKYMDNVTTLFRFFVQNGVIKVNIFENRNLRAVEKRRACDRRQRFSKQDLKNIFEEGKYFKPGTRDKLFKESYYWIPLIALYTGARVTEISQLHVSDILKIENIWCISIDETVGIDPRSLEYKSLKNKSSCRIIPIHDQLLNLGFIKFVEKEKKSGNIRLFNDITRRKKGIYAGIVGGWFNKNKKNYFNIDNSKQSFHSFRHTFIDELKQLGVKEELVAVVVGHARQSITFNVYGKDYSVALIKQKVIDPLDFEIKVVF